MNKTSTVNLSGQIFNIDDDAYALLKTYLDKLRNRLKSDEDREEIIQDFEQALAEHLLELLKSKEGVVTTAMVKKVTKIIGEYEPSSEAEDTELPDDEATNTGHWHRLFKHPIYLDKDNAFIGGVCAGIARSLEIDPFWVRVVFILIVFGSWGVGIIAYIVLMLIMRDPQNISEQLRAEGFQPTAAALVAHSKKRFKDAQANIANAHVERRLSPVLQFVKKLLRLGATVFSATLITLITIAYVVLVVSWLAHSDSTNQPFISSPGGVNYGLLLGSYLVLVLPLLLVLLVSASRRLARTTMALRVSALLFGTWLVALVLFVACAAVAVPDWADWSRQHPKNGYFQLNISDGHLDNLCVNLAGNCDKHAHSYRKVIPSNVIPPMPPKPPVAPVLQ